MCRSICHRTKQLVGLARSQHGVTAAWGLLLHFPCGSRTTSPGHQPPWPSQCASRVVAGCSSRVVAGAWVLRVPRGCCPARHRPPVCARCPLLPLSSTTNSKRYRDTAEYNYSCHNCRRSHDQGHSLCTLHCRVPPYAHNSVSTACTASHANMPRSSVTRRHPRGPRRDCITRTARPAAAAGARRPRGPPPAPPPARWASCQTDSARPGAAAGHTATPAGMRATHTASGPPGS